MAVWGTGHMTHESCQRVITMSMLEDMCILYVRIGAVDRTWGNGYVGRQEVDLEV